MSATPVVLESRNVDMFYGKRQVLKDVSLEIRRGQLAGIVGENGAGKTTLLKILVSLVAPTRGRVSIAGRLGYCPQDALLFEKLTVRENLDYFATAYGLPHADRACASSDHRRELTDWLGLDLCQRTLASDLSAGMRQKLNLAVSLLHDPDILVLDEPYNAFDWATYLLFWENATKWRDRGKTIVVVSHLIYDRSRFDQILTLKDGVLGCG